MAVWVSLLRGINVGGHNRVNMPQLREALTAAGFRDVKTYVQSGNVITDSLHRNAERVAAAVREVIAERFGLDVPVVVRSPSQLQAVLDWCPFPDAAENPTKVHVVHLFAAPDPARLPAVLDQDWGGDAIVARGSELVIRYGDSMHTSKLQYATTLKRLGVDGTARNWRTLQSLVDLTS